MNLYHLQNGSDIRGTAIETESEAVTLTSEIAGLFAKGFVTYLRKHFNKENICVAVGHDSRLSAETLKRSIIENMVELGVQVFDTHLSSTPSMFCSTQFEAYSCDGAIMITASHLPFQRNGMKFFDRNGGLNKADIKEIITYAVENNFTSKAGGSVAERDLISDYALFLRNLICERVNHPTNYNQPLSGLHIVVDAGNGSGGFYVSKVLEPLGANCEGSQFLNPDGSFPNHIPNPEDKKAMASIRSAVLKNNADLGIIFDTDVDRSSAVDKYGNPISRNAIVALAAALVHKKHPGTAIVTDSTTSDELHDFLENELHVKHLRYRRGYKNVINKAMELNEQGIDCQLAIETSGHAAFKENFFLDDGAYLATLIVIEAALMHQQGQSIDQLIANLKHPLEAKEVRIPILCDDFQDYGSDVLETLFEYAKNNDTFLVADDNYEGIRVSFDENHGNGWFLLRQSLHDPILPINVESKDEGGCKIILAALYEVLQDFNSLDLRPLKKEI